MVVIRCSVPTCLNHLHAHVGQCPLHRVKQKSPSYYLRRHRAWPEIRRRVLQRDGHACQHGVPPKR